MFFFRTNDTSKFIYQKYKNHVKKNMYILRYLLHNLTSFKLHKFFVLTTYSQTGLDGPLVIKSNTRYTRHTLPLHAIDAAN